MSPYERPPPSAPSSCHTAIQVLLSEFDVTSNGFLPQKAPLERLQDPYYAPWESLISRLPSSLEAQTFRDEINKLPILSSRDLTAEEEQRRAYLVLTFFAHAYIWGDPRPSEVLPPPITIPLLQISDTLGLPPVATFASLNLWNFRSTNPLSDFTDLDSLTALHTFTGTRDESWFYMVSVAIEARGAYIIPILLSALSSLQQFTSSPTTPDPLPAATATLTSLTTCMTHLSTLLDRMHSHCDPTTFYHRIRPFLAGSKNMAAAGLPSGVFYDEGDGRGEWRQLRGGSNGQSSLVQFLDLVLGVEHSAGGCSDPDREVGKEEGDGQRAMGFHEEVRGYMPRRHREFLGYVVGLGGGFRRVIGELRRGRCDGDGGGGEREREFVELEGAFKKATKALAEFRNRHLQLVTRYIIIPSRQAQKTSGCGEIQGVRNLATATSSGTHAVCGKGGKGADTETKSDVISHVELTGTGGTALLPFLKQSRDETLQAGEVEG